MMVCRVSVFRVQIGGISYILACNMSEFPVHSIRLSQIRMHILYTALRYIMSIIMYVYNIY